MKVTYLDHMGTDLTVVNAARVSFGKKSKGYVITDNVLGTKSLSKEDKSLIQFLARGCTSGDWGSLVKKMAIETFAYRVEELEDLLNHIRRMPPHWTPFGHCQISLHLKVPIFVARQIMKHQTGFVVNEVSRRYVTDEPEFYVPDVWRKAADNVKQGSSSEEVKLLCANADGVQVRPLPYRMTGGGGQVNTYVREGNLIQLKLYHEMLESDICPELARMVLPLSTYTEFWMTGSLYGWANLYNQRSDSHAQKETQEVAKQIGEIIEPLYPESWRALIK